MSQYTVFYNSDKEIEMVLNGQADSATISAQEGTGLSTLVVDVDNTPTDHYYVNDAEDELLLAATTGLAPSSAPVVRCSTVGASTRILRVRSRLVSDGHAVTMTVVAGCRITAEAFSTSLAYRPW